MRFNNNKEEKGMTIRLNNGNVYDVYYMHSDWYTVAKDGEWLRNIRGLDELMQVISENENKINGGN